MNKSEKYRYLSFLRGLNNDEAPTQIKPDMLAVARNVEIIGRGEIKCPRPGTGYFGNTIATNPTSVTGLSVYLNEVSSIKKLVLVVNGTAKYFDENTEDWTAISGATFTTGYTLATALINNTMYLSNGVDPLTMYDGTTLTRFTLISPPSGMSLTRGASLPSGMHKISYRISADNGIGETTATASTTIQVNKARDDWNFDPNSPDGNYSVSISWASVAGAIKYNIYGVTEGYETYLDSVSGGGTNYIDYGLKIPSVLFTPPEGNRTQAPKGDLIIVFKGALIIAGDPSFPSRLYYSGGGSSINSFTLGDGGGWIDVNSNSDDGRIIDLRIFQNKLIVFKEKSIWQFDFTTTLIPSLNVVSKGIGGISKRGAANMGNDLAFVGKTDGGIPALFVLGNEPNLPEILRTNELSLRVRPEFEALPEGQYDDVALWYFDNRLYIGYTKGGTTYNNTILVYDREQLSYVVWDSIYPMLPIIWEDSADTPHVIFHDPTDNRITEISSEFETDKGQAISWELRTRQETGKDYERFKRVRWETLHLQNAGGRINIKLYLDNDVTTISKVFSQGQIDTALGSYQVGYGNTIGTTDSGGEANIENILTTSIPVHRLGINSVVQSYGLGLSGETTTSKLTLIDRAFEWQYMGANRKILSNILQI